MTPDAYSRLAKEELAALIEKAAGKDSTNTADAGGIKWLTPDFLERFAEIVAAKEREECAKECEKHEKANLYGVKVCATAVRNRGVKMYLYA